MCPSTTDLGNLIWNDFNRKDLFTQHLRRMHVGHAFSRVGRGVGEDDGSGLSRRGGGEVGISDEAILGHQSRCYILLRENPLRSGCLFCSRTFLGEGSWEERMEHVGAHFEAERKKGVIFTGIEGWRDDAGLRDWLEGEGLIEFEAAGGWRIGDGRPRRRDSVFG